MVTEATAFPAWSEADWRKAAETALKGANLDKLVTRTVDGLRIEPVYQPTDGPRSLRAGGPWRVMARLDNPDAREANSQALEDLAGGADGLQIVFAGAIGAYRIRAQTKRSGHAAARLRRRAVRRWSLL